MISEKTNELQVALDQAGIALLLVVGADAHVSPDLLAMLKDGIVPTLAGTKYFLFEPPHSVCPPNLDRLAQGLLDAGYIPILTHPERLSWIERDYQVIVKLAKMGVAIQLTAASLTGRFGDRAAYWSDRIISEGYADLIASDAHSPKGRPPGLSLAKEYLAQNWGEVFAETMTQVNPSRILDDQPLMPRFVPDSTPRVAKSGKSGWRTWLGLSN